MTDATERLSGWLRSVDLDPGATRQDAIREAAGRLAKDTEGRSILDLVLLAHGTPTSEAIDAVATALRNQDDTWAVRSGDRVAELTAAVAAALAMEGPPTGAVPFALAVRSAHFIGLKPTIAELADLARAGLVRASETLRGRSALSVAAADIKGALAEAPEVADGTPLYGEQLNGIVKVIGTAATRASNVTGRALPVVTRRFEAVEEELDLLWWAFGEYSDLAGKPFAAVPLHAAACVSGIELAAHLTHECPLPSGRAILSKVLKARAGKPTDLARAVPAAIRVAGPDWQAAVEEGHQLLPVLSSVSEHRSLRGKRVWKESVGRWKVDSGRGTTVLDLAEQVANEILLSRSKAE